MTEHSKHKHLAIVVASLMLLVGTSCNIWTLDPMINPEGVIASPFKRWLIWLFDILMVLMGMVLLKFRNSPHIMKRFIPTATKLLCSLLVMELTLHVAAVLSPRARTVLSEKAPAGESRTIRDDVLGWRPNPAFPEHDKLGWRNPEATAGVDVVALGDSQTYGTGVKPLQSWPQLLSEDSIRPYSMAFGGYGPVHACFLMNEALAMKPRLVIMGFYAGNDLYDSYNVAYNNAVFQQFKSADKETLAVIAEAENAHLLSDEVHRLFRQTMRSSQQSRLANVLRKSKLYCLGLALERAVNRYVDSVQSWQQICSRAKRDSKSYMVFSHGDTRTVFASQSRLLALNQQDPRIREGLRISLEAIRLMRNKARDAGVEFLVLLIPTKELVFKDVVYAHTDNVCAAYRATVTNEESMRREAIAFLAAAQIHSVDCLPALRHSLKIGTQPYRRDWDGHLNEAGHCAVAQLLLPEIKVMLNMRPAE